MFSVDRLGENGAKLAATLIRMAWLIDLEMWRPDDGDPLATLPLGRWTEPVVPED